MVHATTRLPGQPRRKACQRWCGGLVGPGSVSGGRLMAGITEVSAPPAAAAVFRCSCCASDLAAAASSRSLMARYRRARASALRRRSVAYSRIIAAIIAAMSRKVMVFPPLSEVWDRWSLGQVEFGTGGVWDRWRRGEGEFGREEGWEAAGPALCEPGP